MPDYKVYERINDDEEIIKSIDCVYFGWDNVKWYENYTEIDFIMEFIKDCKYYAFCRIGESSEGDIESHEHNMDMIDYHFIFDKELNDKYNLYDITIEDIINELIDNVQDDIDIIEDKFKELEGC